jgi:hypothetical protein
VLTITSLVFCEKYYLKLFAVHFDRSSTTDGTDHLDCSERCVQACCNQDDCCKSANRLRLMWGVQILLAGLVLLLTMIGVLVFGVSCVIFLLDFILLFACENVANFVSGVCLDLTPIGDEVVLCGEDFAFFCNELSLMETTTMLIGCLLIVIGEFFCALEAGITFGMLTRKPINVKDVHNAMLTRKITPLQRALHSRVSGGFHEVDVYPLDLDAKHKYQAATPQGLEKGGNGLSFGGSIKYQRPLRDNRAASISARKKADAAALDLEGIKIHEDVEEQESVEMTELAPKEEEDGKEEE